MNPDDIDASEIAAQNKLLGQVAADLHRDHTERNRANRLTRWAASLAFVLAVVNLAALGAILMSTRQSQDNGRDIKEVLTIVDPTSPRGRAAAAQQQQVLGKYQIDQDCRTRRAIAHLPPPPVDKKGIPVPCVMPDQP